MSAAPPNLYSRTLLYGCAALVALYGWFLAAAWAHGYSLLAPTNGPANFDFSAFWAAGRLASHGQAQAAYQWDHLEEVLQRALGRSFAIQVLPWFYPPIFLLAVTPLGLLPYGTAAALWLGATLAAYLAAARAILPGGTAAFASLAAPAVAFNLWSGQNGLLTAALLGGGLFLLDASPVASGILFGLLCYKPQFGLLLPLFLAATGRWRVFFAAAATVLTLVSLTAAAFGWQIFAIFLGALHTANDMNLGAGRQLGHVAWSHLQSVYGMLRALGAAGGVAWAAQILVSLGAGGVALAVAARGVSPSLEAALVATAAFVVTPYSQTYDLTVPTLGLAFLVRDGLEGGFRPWEKPALLAVFLLPLGFLSLRSMVGLGPLTSALLAAVIAARGKRQLLPASIIS
ncbi:MAG TPA: glycosyltransferase family 87 protein [Stellaceae bacterium]|nr:glycosyltransferase family 87 protein [Stellaceae bacterium]